MGSYKGKDMKDLPHPQIFTVRVVHSRLLRVTL